MGGFHRRIRITPTPGRVTAAVEDDFHCMAVTLAHDGATVAQVDAAMDRWPWSTCSGAADMVRQTFTGAHLTEMTARGQKTANCTHLYDLALFAAAHAGETQPITYDALVSDPIDDRVSAELCRNGEVLHRWELLNGAFVAPADLTGKTLFEIREWVASLPADLQEAARILQWASLIARGRTIPIEAQSDASRMPPNCYSFQPERARRASRVGRIMDFSNGPGAPLDHFNGAEFESQRRAGRLVWPQ